jgi:hypothetical protein
MEELKSIANDEEFTRLFQDLLLYESPFQLSVRTALLTNYIDQRTAKRIEEEVERYSHTRRCVDLSKLEIPLTFCGEDMVRLKDVATLCQDSPDMFVLDDSQPLYKYEPPRLDPDWGD